MCHIFTSDLFCPLFPSRDTIVVIKVNTQMWLQGDRWWNAHTSTYTVCTWMQNLRHLYYTSVFPLSGAGWTSLWNACSLLCLIRNGFTSPSGPQACWYNRRWEASSSSSAQEESSQNSPSVTPGECWSWDHAVNTSLSRLHRLSSLPSLFFAGSCLLRRFSTDVLLGTKTSWLGCLFSQDFKLSSHYFS